MADSRMVRAYTEQEQPERALTSGVKVIDDVVFAPAPSVHDAEAADGTPVQIKLTGGTKEVT